MSEVKTEIEMTKLTPVPVENIHPLGDHVNTIYFKHKYSSYVIGTFGIACFFLRNIWGIGLGLTCLAYALFVYFFIPNHKVCEVYSESIVIYSDDEATKGNCIPFDDFSEWGSINNAKGVDAIMIKFADGYTIYKDTFQIGTFYRTMIRLVPDKETKKVLREKQRAKSSLHFHNPFKKWFKKK